MPVCSISLGKNVAETTKPHNPHYDLFVQSVDRKLLSGNARIRVSAEVSGPLLRSLV